ncbi:ATP-binding protein [Rhodoblastus acidophilus]|uniref:ATP-binding protein n=1 Tax=Candidatus Rhodoblastus alkanivorans TaxID=2954117 RepID=A0ABS9Z9B5_9HYPH|nr:ATP-binding protein [Candidatus Rhodoblastus alkanivorans]MCI4680425.1 ATP-binding protein [Candidatus Rhodoblastus alkanivorans]MCI4683212.1 ATP-binding protein [Candidatus Rhodoblastus alkanivorans]MDI4640524.1 ATP-binding protein [Rhodoblastus acidophilus]
MAFRFVETSISRGIDETVTYSRATLRAAAIIGPPGIGKTVALERLYANDRKAIYLRISATQGTGKAAFRLLGDAMGVARGGRESTDSIWRALEDRFDTSGSWKQGEYLLIDEAQQLDLNVLKELVDLPSRFGFPVVVCGNPDLLKRTKVDRGAYEQIVSRCSKRLVLKAPLDEDLVAIALDFDVYGADARAAAVSYGQNTSIRELVQLLEDARTFVASGPIRLNDLRQTAVNTKGGSQALKLLSPAA